MGAKRGISDDELHAIFKTTAKAIRAFVEIAETLDCDDAGVRVVKPQHVGIRKKWDKVLMEVNEGRRALTLRCPSAENGMVLREQMTLQDREWGEVLTNAIFESAFTDYASDGRLWEDASRRSIELPPVARTEIKPDRLRKLSKIADILDRASERGNSFASKTADQILAEVEARKSARESAIEEKLAKMPDVQAAIRQSQQFREASQYVSETLAPYYKLLNELIDLQQKKETRTDARQRQIDVLGAHIIDWEPKLWEEKGCPLGEDEPLPEEERRKLDERIATYLGKETPKREDAPLSRTQIAELIKAIRDGADDRKPLHKSDAWTKSKLVAVGKKAAGTFSNSKFKDIREAAGVSARQEGGEGPYDTFSRDEIRAMIQELRNPRKRRFRYAKEIASAWAELIGD